MKTAFTFYDSKTASDGASSNPTPDQRPGGFAPASGANNIGLLVLPKKAAMLVKKPSVCARLSLTPTRRGRLSVPVSALLRPVCSQFYKGHDLRVQILIQQPPGNSAALYAPLKAHEPDGERRNGHGPQTKPEQVFLASMNPGEILRLDWAGAACMNKGRSTRALYVGDQWHGAQCETSAPGAP